MMTAKQEKELLEKGYMLKLFNGTFSEAKKEAERLRGLGFRARVAEYATRVKGYHDLAIWYKRK